MFIYVMPSTLGYWLWFRNSTEIVGWWKWQMLLTYLPGISLVFFLVFVVTQLRSINLVEALGFLGFRKPKMKQVFVGFVIVLPLIVAFSFLFNEYLKFGANVRFDYNQGLIFISFLISAGIFEEVFNRGFIYQSVRQGRSFFFAAFFSGLFWAFSHVFSFSSGNFHQSEIPAFAMMALKVIVFAFPSAYVFERTGNSIWSWVIVHVGYDASLDLANHSQGAIKIKTFCVLGLVVSLLITYPVIEFFYPKKKQPDLRLGTEINFSNENSISPKLTVYLFLFLISITVLTLGLIFVFKK
jgi:membrane protease YdiL (CAAX protease family)